MKYWNPNKESGESTWVSVQKVEGSIPSKCKYLNFMIIW